MGAIASRFIIRPLRNFNVDNRAMKVIQSEEIRPAPKHKKSFGRAKKEENKEMQETLLERLKLVKVVSDSSSVKQQEQREPKFQLPQDRSYSELPEYGFVEGESIPKGKASLRMILEFLNHHQTDPKVWNAQLIAKEYNLDITLTEQILKHFSLYNVILPEKGQQKNRFFGTERWKKSFLPAGTTTNKT